MSLAAKLPYDHPYAGGYPGIGSQPLPTDADAIDYLARMATADGAGVETGVAVAVDAFFKDAKESGVFSSIRASCLLAGARTLAGALVPLKNEGPELWATPSSASIVDSGTDGAFDAATQTLTNTTGSAAAYPRFRFTLTEDLRQGTEYIIEGRFSGDIAAVYGVRPRNAGVVLFLDSETGEFSGTVEQTSASVDFEILLNASVQSNISVTIESLSIREVIAAPTNVADGFVEGDYTRGGATPGLKGDGTSYLDSGRANDDDPQNDNHNSIYFTQAYSNGSTLEIAASTSAGRNMINVAANVFTRCRDATEINTGISSGAEGLVGFSRNSSAGYGVRAYGSDYAATAPSDGVASENVFVFAGNNGGSPIGISSARLAFYSIGTSLSLEDLDAAVSNLITAIGEAL